MIEKFISFPDLLALLLAIAISGLIIFFLFFIGFINSEAEHVGSDSDIDTDTDIDHDVGSDFDHDIDTDIDHDIGSDFDHDFDTGINLDHDIDTDVDVDHDIDTDVDTDIDTDHDFHADTDHEVTTASELHMDFDAHISGELVKTIETDGGGSLFAQIGAFCLAFGLFGFFFVLSLGPVETSELVTKLDIAIAVLFVLGMGAYKVSNKMLRVLTKGSISPPSTIMTGQQITVVSKLIDYQTQGRVLVLTPDGEKIMMAISHDPYDLFYEGDSGVVLQPGTPIKISKYLLDKETKSKGF